MVYSILLVVKKPDENNYKRMQVYDNFVAILAGLEKQNIGLRLLSQNSVLLPLNDTLQGVLEVLRALRDLPYTYSILTEDTRWYEAINKV